MPFLALDCLKNRAVPHRGGDLRACLREALADLPDGAPVVVLLHGYTFSPLVASRNPHTHILSLKPQYGGWKALSWPRHLGFGSGKPEEGLCLTLGWEARGTIWQAWRSAGQASAVLADVVHAVQAIRPGAVDIVAHSLGARVALGAVAALPAGSLGRLILIAGAEFQSTAARALSTAAGRTAEVINVKSRENWLFDTLLELLVRRRTGSDRALGAGLWTGADNWLDLQVDGCWTRGALRQLGHAIPRPQSRVCHWWGYLRPGLMPLYRDLIRNREKLTLELLKVRIETERLARNDFRKSFPLRCWCRAHLTRATQFRRRHVAAKFAQVLIAGAEGLSKGLPRPKSSTQ